MKKLYTFIGCLVCLSSTFAAGVQPEGEFDDCDEKVKPGYKEPNTTPQAGPQAQVAADFMMPLSLPNAGSKVPTEDQSPAGSNDVRNILPELPELKIYYTEHDGDETSLKRFTPEVLTTDYAALSCGGAFEARFIPDVTFRVDVDATSESRVSQISIFDTIGWLANVRAWAKWYLNPWAWWNPSRYSLEANCDRVEWDSVTSQATIRLTTVKDLKYLNSQLRLFLLSGWKSKFAPYIAPVTQKTLERAVVLRFENVERPALEAVGFKNVTLSTRVNPVTNRLERSIQATK